MRGYFLQTPNSSFIEHNIYGDRSSLILRWLLNQGLNQESFSLRELARYEKVSIGLVHNVIKQLIMEGILEFRGERTSKTFSNLKRNILINNWINHYSILKKCKMRTYDTGLNSNNEIFQSLIENQLNQKCALALHSSAEALGYKNNNIKTVELYLLDSSIRKQIEHCLELEPKERGYRVLLIEPYYKSLLKSSIPVKKDNEKWLKISEFTENCLLCSPELLTFLDLYHFPLRGLEQAEYMSERIAFLKNFMAHRGNINCE
jgi:hypothetical protein